MRLGTVAVAGAVASGVLAVGVVVAVVSPVSSAFAQTPPATPTPRAKVDRGADYLAKLAANLGVTVDALKAANAQTAGQLIDEAVTAGKLTAEQGAQAKARLAAGGKGGDGKGAFGFAGPRFGGKGQGGPGGPGNTPGARGPQSNDRQRGPQSGNNQRGPIGGPNATAAAAIGIDAATLQSELRAGKSLAEIAVAHGKTREALKAALAADQDKKLDAMIDRKITPKAPKVPKPAVAPTVTAPAS